MPTIQPSATAPSRPPAGAWRFDALLLALFPVIQIGFSFWVSVATLAALLTIVRLRDQLIAGFRQHPWLLGLPLVMMAPFVFEFSLDPGQDLLRIGREALAACLMFWIITGSAIRPGMVDVRRTTLSVSVLAAGLSILAVIQFGLLRRGVYFGFPEGAFALETGTLPTELDLMYSRLRPAATYAEPSYLAFILLSLLLVLAARFARDRGGRPALAIVLFTGLLSQAFSFLLFGAALVGVLGMRTLRGATRLFLLPIALGFAPVLLGVALTLLGDEFVVIDRIRRLSEGAEDFSIFVRIFGPLGTLPYYLAQFPIGQPFSTVLPSISGYAVTLGINPLEYLMNGLWNLFFQYGYLGLPIAALFLIRRDLLVSVYMFSCMFFNGSFLQIDKLAIICLTVFLYHAVLRSPLASPDGRRRQLRLAYAPPERLAGNAPPSPGPGRGVPV